MSISPLEETSSQGGRSLDEIAKELAGGRVLESGPVVNFEGTKDDTSKAEQALAAARKADLANPSAHASYCLDSPHVGKPPHPFILQSQR